MAQGGTGKDKGFAKIKNRKLIYGIGINDFPASTIDENGKQIYEYITWKSMFTQCYCPIYHSRQPSYIDCHVDEYFHSFNNFYNYIQTMPGYGELDDNSKKFQLDKDIINNKSKCYSKETICLVPREINNLLINSAARRGLYPVGVHKDKRYSTYQTKLTIDGIDRHLGTYKTPEDAFEIYKNAKEDRIKILAEKWKNKIDHRVYRELINYDIKITD